MCPQICSLKYAYFLCELGLQAKFQNPWAAPYFAWTNNNSDREPVVENSSEQLLLPVSTLNSCSQGRVKLSVTVSCVQGHHMANFFLFINPWFIVLIHVIGVKLLRQ